MSTYFGHSHQFQLIIQVKPPTPSCSVFIPVWIHCNSLHNGSYEMRAFLCFIVVLTFFPYHVVVKRTWVFSSRTCWHSFHTLPSSAWEELCLTLVYEECFFITRVTALLHEVWCAVQSLGVPSNDPEGNELIYSHQKTLTLQLCPYSIIFKA